MNAWTDTSLIVALLAVLMTLGSSRIALCIRLVAVQGIALSLLPVTTSDTFNSHVWLLAVGTLLVKGILLPWFLHKTSGLRDEH